MTCDPEYRGYGGCDAPGRATGRPGRRELTRSRATRDGRFDTDGSDPPPRSGGSHGSLGRETYASVAPEGVSPGTATGAAASLRYQPVVASDREDGTDRGVEGTPTTFVNGEKAVPADDRSLERVIVDAIESEL